MRLPAKVAVMQPYFFPYIGYWQLMNAVDSFVVYDNIQFTKKGWIHRNRFLHNGEPALFSLPLKKDSDYLDVRERELSGDFSQEREKLLRRIAAAYRRAPMFEQGYHLFKSCLEVDERNLFNFILHSINAIRNYLQITTPIHISSTLPVEHSLKGQDRVLAICAAMQATEYYNPVGGVALYNSEAFDAEGIKLNFQQVGSYTYPQFAHDFQPHLSILDVIMFNDVQAIKSLLENVSWFASGTS